MFFFSYFIMYDIFLADFEHFFFNTDFTSEIGSPPDALVFMQF